MTENVVNFEFTDEQVKDACEILRKSYIELSDDVMPQSKRFMFARQYGRESIMLNLQRNLMLKYAALRKEAEEKGETFKSPTALLEENKEKIREQFAADMGRDFSTGIEL